MVLVIPLIYAWCWEHLILWKFTTKHLNFIFAFLCWLNGIDRCSTFSHRKLILRILNNLICLLALRFPWFLKWRDFTPDWSKLSSIHHLPITVEFIPKPMLRT